MAVFFPRDSRIALTSNSLDATQNVKLQCQPLNGSLVGDIAGTSGASFKGHKLSPLAGPKQWQLVLPQSSEAGSGLAEQMW